MNQKNRSAPIPQPEDSGDRLRQLHMMLAGRYHYAIILGILGVLAGGMGAHELVTPVYRSEGSVQVEQFAQTLMGSEEQRIRNLESYIQAQIETIASSEIINDALKTQKWRDAGRDLTPIEFAMAIGTDYDARRGRANEIFRITFTDEKPQAAQAGLAALLSTYEQWNAKRDSELKTQLLRALERMRADCQQDIANLTEQIWRVAPKGLEGLTFESEEAMQQIKLVAEEREKTRLAIAAAARMPLEESTAPASVDALITQIAESGDPTMNALLSAWHNAQAQERYAELHTGSEHVQTKRARNAVRIARQSVEEYALNFNTELLGDAAQLLAGPELQKRFDELTELYNRLDTQIANLARLRLNVQQLERRRQLENDRLVQIITRITNETTPGALDENRVRVLSMGALPTEPYNASQQKQMAVMGGALGGALGVGLILVIGGMDRRLRDSEDVKWTTGGAGLLGVLPALPKDLADPEQAAIASHCVHHIRALLQLTDDDEPGRVFSVTSPASGTGKTSLALALGLSFAESGSRTLLIDCDLFGGQLSARVNAIVRRRIGQILKTKGMISESQLEDACRRAGETRHKIGTTLVEMGLLTENDVTDALQMQADTRVGLLDALGGEDMGQCVAETGFKNLAILPIGQAQPHDAGRLSPTSIRGLFHEALKRYDIILIDTGPIPASLEASVVASEADGVVLTVSRGEQRPLAAKAKKHLESIGAHVAGVVFNRAENHEVDSYSYRPRSISGEPVLPGTGRVQANVQAKNDQRTATYGPIAQAVSLSAPPDTNGRSRTPTANGNGRQDDAK